MSAATSVTSRHFLSCDWGTTAFRLRLIDAANLHVVAERRGDAGVAATFADWKAAGENIGHRWKHYRRVIEHHLALLAGEGRVPLIAVPLVISGMASSSIGMRELPYSTLPFAVDGSNLHVECIDATSDFPHRTFLISGVRSDHDVMRGEETQLVGACAAGAMDTTATNHIYVFPGTHSKHVHVFAGRAIAFKTYMTGEFFELLARKSILASSVSAESNLESDGNLAGFEAGVLAGANDSLLHAAFRVRTRALLEHAAPGENFHYLSGLLIGAEVRELITHDTAITLVGGGPLLIAYRHAFRALAAPKPISTQDVDACLIAGQQAVATRLGAL